MREVAGRRGVGWGSGWGKAGVGGMVGSIPASRIRGLVRVGAYPCRETCRRAAGSAVGFCVHCDGICVQKTFVRRAECFAFGALALALAASASAGRPVAARGI